jgi:phosphatidylinositol 3-kinase
VSEALKLLSGGKAFQSPLVRSYAVDVLRNASDQELQILLLQLVQALRYEPMIIRSDDEIGPLSPNTIDTSENENLESQEELKVEGFEDLEKLPATAIPSLSALPPLARFLISRACTSTIRMRSLFPISQPLCLTHSLLSHSHL